MADEKVVPKDYEIPDRSIQIAVDRGGTFTDVYASWPSTTDPHGDREEKVLKLLSVDEKYGDAPREGVRRVLELATGKEVPRDNKLETKKIGWIRLSTTVATNALLERRGADHALVITKGFKDLLLIGTQSRPKIFDLAIRKPQVLYDDVVEVDERVTLVGYTSDPKRKEREVQFDDEGKVKREYVSGVKDPPKEHLSGEVKKGLSGEAVRVMKVPDEKKVREDLQALYDKGVRSLAVVLMHSYTYPEHEEQIHRIATSIGFTHISLSSKLMPMIKIVARGTSSTADAYLTPVLMDYINGFFDGFEKELREGVEENKEGKEEGDRRTRVEFMMSDGGLTDVGKFTGLKSILSGPAGGVVGYALTSWDEEKKTPVIGLDMGGTSTDVSRFDGRPEIVFETTTAGITIQSPQLDINTVAAGGGSRLFFRNALFTVGPESAGANPGPACYRKGGPLAVTDANLLLGRLIPDFFPKIFGKKGDESLDLEASKKAFDELAREINEQTGKNMSLDEVAWGFLQVANETMCRPIRALTEARGYSTAKHILSCFGGAGGQHACSIAAALGIKTILIHRHSSVLSAYGMALADRVYEQQEPCSETYNDASKPRLKEKIEKLSKEVKEELSRQGFEDKRIKAEAYLNLRYDGTDTALMVLQPEDEDFAKAFADSYKQEFGFVLEGKDTIVDDIRIRGIGKSFDSLGESVFAESSKLSFKPVSDSKSKYERSTSVYFQNEGRMETPVFLLEKLERGDLVKGPAIIIDRTQTLVVDPDAEAKITYKHVWIELNVEKSKKH